MKRTTAVLTACLVLFGAMPYAGALFHWDDIKVIPVEAGLDFSDSLYTVARETDTQRIVPLSETSGAYLYAYHPGDGALEAYRAAPVQFADAGGWGFGLGVDGLSARGVIQGTPDGRFMADAALSHAEMCVLLARLFGLEGTQAYADVADNAWYAPAVGQLAQAGALPDAQAFEPDRAVERRELVGTAYALLTAVGALKTPVEPADALFAQVKDADSLTDTERAAYAGMLHNGYVVLEDRDYHDDMDTSDDEVYLRADTAVSREEAAEFLYSLLRHFMTTHYPPIATELAAAYGLDEQMPRIDGSTSSYPLTQAIYGALFTNGYNHPSMPASHSKTITSYERLIAGDADIILVPDPSSDVTALAEHSGVELEYVPIASEALVFFTGKDNPVAGLTSGQIRDIYVDNAYASWSALGGPDAPLAAFCRNNDSGSHAQMERFFLGGQPIHEQIRQERTSVMMASILTDVQDYERENPGTYALGYSMYYYYTTAGMILGTENLKLLAVDGVLPDEQSIAQKSYPLSTYYYAVLRADTPEDAPARKLVQWLTSEDGRVCVENAGFGALAVPAQAE